MAKFCTNCGTQLADEVSFCTECGNKLEVTEQAAAPAEAVSQPESQGTVSQPAPQPLPQSTVPQPAPTYARQSYGTASQKPVYQQTAPQQPMYQPIPQPAAGAAQADTLPAGSKYEPISTWGYIGIMLLMCIPIVGIVLVIVWALGGCRKINKRNMARASLIMMAVGLVFSLIIGAVLKSTVNKVTNSIEKEIGISLGGDKDEKNNAKDDKKDETSALGMLAGLLGGASEDGKHSGGEEITNSDIEALGELGELLGSLGALTGGDVSGLEELIEGAEQANKDAEAANDGWPKSLRAYPGGTAAAVASYRTQISDTTEEEMLGWIEDLKKDGFEYTDFYDFGMSEEDMLSVSGWWATDGEIYLSVSYYEGVVTVDHTKELPDLGSYFE